jgi:hypothetical protein
MNYKQRQNIKLLVALLLASLLNASCGIVNSAVRDYSQKTFDRTDWKKGDAIERGRMLFDIYKSRSSLISGKSEPELLEIFGEPDTKKEIKGQMVWFYNLEFPRDSKRKMAISIVRGSGKYGIENQSGQMTADEF